MVASACVVLASGVVTMSVPYSEGIGLKQLVWLGHSGVIGAFLTPMCFMGGPLLIRAAWYTAGIVGGQLCSISITLHITKFTILILYHE